MTNIDDDQLSTMQLIKTEKQIAGVFKGSGLSVTMKCNPKLVDFLDVTFDPVDEICKSYRKPNNKPLYIKKHCNHPPNISKQLPKSNEKRICEASSNIDVLNRSIKIYNDALHESNFKETLQFVIPAPKNNDENQKRKRKRNTICFNRPYSKNIKTVIGKTFLQPLSKHFHKDYQMHIIFHKNTVV